MNPVLPKPEQLDSVTSCEMAALLVTLGFQPADDQMTVARGEGIPGGSAGYWRFLPICTGTHQYDLKAVLAHGLSPRQAAVLPTAQMPVYEEQAYIAAAFHNYKMLLENIALGTRLRLIRCGFLYYFVRHTPLATDPVYTPAEMAHARAHGSNDTQMIAALATLGFEPHNANGVGKVGVDHGKALRTWYLPSRSTDGRWERDERMARWRDDAWCADPKNNDPIACMADAFFNLSQIKKQLSNAQTLIRVQNGSRSVLVSSRAAQSVWDAAETFLTK